MLFKPKEENPMITKEYIEKSFHEIDEYSVTKVLKNSCITTLTGLLDLVVAVKSNAQGEEMSMLKVINDVSLDLSNRITLGYPNGININYNGAMVVSVVKDEIIFSMQKSLFEGATV